MPPRLDDPERPFSMATPEGSQEIPKAASRFLNTKRNLLTFFWRSDVNLFPGFCDPWSISEHAAQACEPPDQPSAIEECLDGAGDDRAKRGAAYGTEDMLTSGPGGREVSRCRVTGVGR
jgi:hypothetical protein